MGYQLELLCLFLTVWLQQQLHAAPAAGTEITTKALSFMSTFGYYKMPDASVGQIAKEEDIRNAIKDMQRFASIPVSGIIDDATKKLMETPRCGMRDVERNLLNAKRKRRYLLQGSKWNKVKLTWKLLNDNNDGLTRFQVEEVMTNAFDKWAKVTSLEFTKLDISDKTQADIDVQFVRYYHDDAYPFDGEGGTLAHAFYPHNNQGLSGDVHFDDDEYFTIGSPKGRSLLWVAVHEIGHSIGLGHSNIYDAVMYPYYRGNEGKDFDLHEDDKLGVQNIYGSRAPDPEKPITGPTTTTTTTTPKPGVTIPPPPKCIDTFKAGFVHPSSQKTYIINGNHTYMLGTNLGIEKGPFPVKDIFPDTDSADAVYVKRNGNIIVFKDKMYYIYNGINDNVLESGTIQNKYGVKSSVERIDAAFIWNGNGRTYLFAGGDYYRFDETRQTMDYGYPKQILSNWKGLPESVNAVFTWRNKIAYFFKDNQFYRFNDEDIKVEEGYPKEMLIWTQCKPDSLQQQNVQSSSITQVSSTLFTALTLIASKLLR